MIGLLEFLLISLAIQIILFIPAFIFKTDTLTDLSYSMTFALIAIISYTFSTQSLTQALLLGMIMVWAIRLGSYLFVRIQIIGKDKRFDGVREKFLLFFRFWMLQGIVVWLVMIPVILYSQKTSPQLSSLSIIGLVIFLCGFILEWAADKQKFAFKQNKKNKGDFIRSGVWKYSRHPNYFGELLVWIGVFVYTLDFSKILSLLGIVSPIFIFIVLYFGTGVRMLENSYNKRFKNNKNWQEYKKKTHKFIFWFQKK